MVHHFFKFDLNSVKLSKIIKTLNFDFEFLLTWILTFHYGLILISDYYSLSAEPSRSLSFSFNMFNVSSVYFFFVYYLRFSRLSSTLVDFWNLDLLSTAKFFYFRDYTLTSWYSSSRLSPNNCWPVLLKSFLLRGGIYYIMGYVSISTASRFCTLTSS